MKKTSIFMVIVNSVARNGCEEVQSRRKEIGSVFVILEHPIAHFFVSVNFRMFKSSDFFINIVIFCVFCSVSGKFQSIFTQFAHAGGLAKMVYHR